jgi:flavin-dependent dehydrogenase
MASAAVPPQPLDVLVIGGGPAGLATAIAARQAGLARVRVVDRRQPPIDKACGEGLMPDGLAALAALEVPVERLPGAALRGIRYLDGGRIAEGRFPRGVGRGLRRPVLHAALAKRAEEIGVELAWGVEALGLTAAGVAAAAGPLAARFVGGADGLHSRVRRWAGLEGRRPGAGAARRFGVRRHFRIAPWTDLVEVHWVDGAEAYVTPVGEREVGVAMLWSGAAARFDGLLARFPALAARLTGVEATSRDRGAGPLLQRVRRVTRPRWPHPERAGAVATGDGRGAGYGLALVGDASGYVDAITGEGLSLAFHQARALARAMADGDLMVYERAHRSLTRLPDALTRLVLALERRPRLRRRAIGALAAEPALFDRLLGVHSRSLPLVRVGLPGALRLAWRLAGAGGG